jgi:hypothetical protein
MDEEYEKEHGLSNAENVEKYKKGAEIVNS